MQLCTEMPKYRQKNQKENCQITIIPVSILPQLESKIAYLFRPKTAFLNYPERVRDLDVQTSGMLKPILEKLLKTKYSDLFKAGKIPIVLSIGIRQSVIVKASSAAYMVSLLFQK